MKPVAEPRNEKYLLNLLFSPLGILSVMTKPREVFMPVAINVCLSTVMVFCFIFSDWDLLKIPI